MWSTESQVGPKNWKGLTPTSRAGGEGGIGDYILKPKGMHKRTFERGLEKVRRAECIVDMHGELLLDRLKALDRKSEGHWDLAQSLGLKIEADKRGPPTLPCELRPYMDGVEQPANHRVANRSEPAPLASIITNRSAAP